MSKKLLTSAMLCSISFAAAPFVDAGAHEIQYVTIQTDDHFQWATGNAGDVFNSQDSTEMIFCQVRGYNYVHGVCFAKTAKGDTLQCNTMEETAIRPMLAINGDSTIQFLVRKGGTLCEGVLVTNGSIAAPKRETSPTAADPSAQQIIGSEMAQ